MMTSFSFTRQAYFWLAFLMVSSLLIWLLRDMLMPFVAGIAVAYFLNPVCEKLEKKGLSRTSAALLVLATFVVVIVLLFLLVAPSIVAQANHFATQMPVYLDHLRDRVQPYLHHVISNISDEDYQRLREAASNYAGQAAGTAMSLVEGIWRGGTALASALSLLFIMPVVAFYLMRDWPCLIERVDRWLPRQHARVIREQVREVDRTLAGFIRGQSLVCLLLAAYFSIALTVVDLNFAIVIGLLTGILSFMPFVGSTFGLVASVLVAFMQYDTYGPVLIVAGIFVFAQFVEGNFITPKLVGENVGLHPIWIIFALMAGGSLLGFVGLLLAVPVAAIIGVLARFLLGNYLQSGYYSGMPNRQRRIKPL